MRLGRSTHDQFELLEVHLAALVRVCLCHHRGDCLWAELLLVHLLDVRLQIRVAAPAAAVSIEARERVLERLVRKVHDAKDRLEALEGVEAFQRWQLDSDTAAVSGHHCRSRPSPRFGRRPVLGGKNDSQRCSGLSLRLGRRGLGRRSRRGGKSGSAGDLLRVTILDRRGGAQDVHPPSIRLDGAGAHLWVPALSDASLLAVALHLLGRLPSCKGLNLRRGRRLLGGSDLRSFGRGLRLLGRLPNRLAVAAAAEARQPAKETTGGLGRGGSSLGCLCRRLRLFGGLPSSNGLGLRRDRSLLGSICSGNGLNLRRGRRLFGGSDLRSFGRGLRLLGRLPNRLAVAAAAEARQPAKETTGGLGRGGSSLGCLCRRLRLFGGLSSSNGLGLRRDRSLLGSIRSGNGLSSLTDGLHLLGRLPSCKGLNLRLGRRLFGGSDLRSFGRGLRLLGRLPSRNGLSFRRGRLLLRGYRNCDGHRSRRYGHRLFGGLPRCNGLSLSRDRHLLGLRSGNGLSSLTDGLCLLGSLPGGKSLFLRLGLGTLTVPNRKIDDKSGIASGDDRSYPQGDLGHECSQDRF